MFRWGLLFVICGLSGLPAFAYERESFELYFDSLSCNASDNNAYLSLLKCYVSKNTKRRTFSIEMQMKQTVPKFDVAMLVVLPRKTGDDFVLLNITKLDGCQLLSNKNQVPFMKLGRSMLDRFSNIPHSCPFLKDVLYYIRGFRFDMSVMPAFNFETNMNVRFDISTGRSTMFTGYIESRVLLKRSNKNRG